jgi:N-acetylmuramoyl-L-alanine amidase
MLVVPYHKIAISIILALWSLLSTSNLYALEISNRYRSPRNPERKIRSSTRLIVLHTTEAPARSSLNKVSDRGECHFCVTENGSVYRIVDRDREAFHAGRSMWQGAEDVDKYSVGIECVGYHNKVMPKAQIAAIRELVKELKSHYKLPDHVVVAHSHVAYGAPNKWH